MDLKVVRAIGSSRLEVTITDRDERLAIAKALFFCERDECGNCHNTADIRWSTRKVKSDKGTFTYVSRSCPKCRYSSDAGEYSEGGVFFWKPWKKYERDAELENEAGRR